MVATAGQMLGTRYRVRKTLGSGAGGEVYECDDLTQGDVVAVKLLDPATHPPGSPWPEANVLTGLRGERILPIRNADIIAGVPVIATAVARHGTLADQVGVCGVAPTVAMRWIRQACTGVQRIHDVGLLHCDLKPENLFLDVNREVLVGDLGLATLRPPHGPSHNFNTPTTVAPEVAHARRLERLTNTVQPGRNNVASELYSLGATAYLLLSGVWPHPPAAGETRDDWLHRIATTAPARLADVAPHAPKDLRDRVEKAMDADPTRRYASPGEFGAALGELRSRPREWVRTDEHPGHERCYRGSQRRGADVVICLVPVAATRYDIEAIRGAGGRLRAACATGVRRSTTDIGRRLRAAFRAAR